MGDTRYGYKLSGGKIWRYTIAAGTADTVASGTQMTEIGTYVGSSTNPTEMAFTQTPPSDFFTTNKIWAPTITLGGEAVKLNSSGTEFEPATSGSGGFIGDANIPNGANRKYTVENGKLIMRDTWSDGSVYKEYELGTVKDGVFTITAAPGSFGVQDLEGFGIGSTSKVIYNGQEGTIQNGNFVPSTGTNSTGTTQINTGVYDGIPGYDPSLLQSGSNGSTYLPTGDVTQDALNRYFIQNWEKSRQANEARWNAAYGGALSMYNQTMQNLQGLGQQEATDIQRNYSNASNAAQMDLVQRGLTGSSIPSSTRLSYQRQSTDALARLNENLRREKIGHQTQAFNTIAGLLENRNDSYPDLTNYLLIKQGLG